LKFITKEKPMKTYQGSEIRNVAVVGHAHSGKTTLIAALLHAAKMTPTQGRVADGSAVTAYDEEEVARGATMQNAVAFAEWQGVKINLVDTPGFHMFTHEARAALLPVEAAVVLVNAQNGVEPSPSGCGDTPKRPTCPASSSSTRWTTPRPAAAAAERPDRRPGRPLGPQLCSRPVAHLRREGFHGVVDLVTMEAFYYTPGGDGRGKVTGEIPASLAADAKARHEALVELVAEGKDELMEEYFEKGTIPEEHLIAALHEAIREDRIFPVLFSSGLANMATDHLLDFIKVYAPSPVERAPIAVAPRYAPPTSQRGRGAGSGCPSTRKVDDKRAGRHGGLQDHDRPLRRPHQLLQGHQRRHQERRHRRELHPPRPGALSHLSVMQGRKAVEVPSCTPATWAPWPSCATPSPATRWAQRAPRFRSISRSPSRP
jgi:elongation factor G